MSLKEKSTLNKSENCFKIIIGHMLSLKTMECTLNVVKFCLDWLPTNTPNKNVLIQFAGGFSPSRFVL